MSPLRSFRHRLASASIAVAVGMAATLASAAPDASLGAAADVSEPPVLPGGDIRDIKDAVEIPEPVAWWPYIGAAALAAVGLGLGKRAFARRASSPSAVAIARARLDEAERRMAELAPAAFAERVSEAVRGYIEARFGILAPHRTTEEFLEDVTKASDSPVAAHVPALDDFLATCDLAKFARSSLSRFEEQELLASAREFVASSMRTGKEGAP